MEALEAVLFVDGEVNLNFVGKFMTFYTESRKRHTSIAESDG